jgi:RHS repeat-associated protein
MNNISYRNRFINQLSKKRSVYLALWRQCLSVLLAYVMLLTPGLESVAQGATQYGQLNTTYSYNDNDQLTSQITDGNSITYTYNADGSLTYIAKDNDADLTYVYDYRNRIVQASIENGATVDYEYNPDGIRVNADIQGGTATDYLLDPFNHTGYPQVFKESTGSSQTAYIIGSEIISQSTGTDDPQYLLRDGHGSVRAAVDSSGVITGNYHFDAYGQLLAYSDTPSTNILYAGQMFDSDIDLYNNWHRWYNPETGLFNRMDDFAGNNFDPQSLHKYNYTHNNPVNAVDPTGQFISPSIWNLVRKFGIDHAVRILIGIRATYVLGDAYIRETSADRDEVVINKWIGRKSDEDLSINDWIKRFMLRPDIVDHERSTVYEVKPDSPDAIAAGAAKILKCYIPILAIRYSGKVYTPGLWQPREPYYTIFGLPGLVGLPPIQISARNAGGGVIAYRIDEQSLRKVTSLVLRTGFYTAITLAMRAEMARATMIPAYATIISTFTRGI